MGYNLRIGEAELDVFREGLYSTVSVDARYKKLDNAPAFGESEDYENNRRPAYGVWKEFCLIVELSNLFYAEDTGILREHPGNVLLVQGHKEAIDAAYTKFTAANPNILPGFTNDRTEIGRKMGALARLTWLKFWVDWAMENCENPVFVNS